MGKTNIDAVKDKAITLLYTEVRESKLYPMMASHPFTNSTIVCVNDNAGTPKVINILENEKLRQEWRNFITEMIRRANTVFDIYCLINKPYSMFFVDFIKDDLSIEDFSKLLADAWIREENPNSDVNMSKRKIIKLFHRADRNILMSAEELENLNQMDDTVIIYRGVFQDTKKSIIALSWTTDRTVAEWFSKRFGANGVVYKAEVDKDDVLAYFLSRGEQEIVVDPSCLRNICKL